MRENESLEEIFDRYAGLELLDRDTVHAPGIADDSASRAALGIFSPEFWGEPLLGGAAGGA